MKAVQIGVLCYVWYTSGVCLVALFLRKGWWERKQPLQFAGVGGGLHSDPFRVTVSVEAKSVHVAVVVNLAKRQRFNVCWDDNAVV